MKPAKIIALTTCLFAFWLAAPSAQAQLTNSLEELSFTNGVMLSYRTLDALKYTPDGRLAMIEIKATWENLKLNHQHQVKWEIRVRSHGVKL